MNDRYEDRIPEDVKRRFGRRWRKFLRDLKLAADAAGIEHPVLYLECDTGLYVASRDDLREYDERATSGRRLTFGSLGKPDGPYELVCGPGIDCGGA